MSQSRPRPRRQVVLPGVDLGAAGSGGIPVAHMAVTSSLLKALMIVADAFWIFARGVLLGGQGQLVRADLAAPVHGDLGRAEQGAVREHRQRVPGERVADLGVRPQSGTEVVVPAQQIGGRSESSSARCGSRSRIVASICIASGRRSAPLRRLSTGRPPWSTRSVLDGYPASTRAATSASRGAATGREVRPSAAAALTTRRSGTRQPHTREPIKESCYAAAEPRRFVPFHSPDPAGRPGPDPAGRVRRRLRCRAVLPRGVVPVLQRSAARLPACR